MYSNDHHRADIEIHFWESLSSTDAFLIAQKYFDMSEFKNSLRWFNLVIRLKDTSLDELFQSHVRASECMMILGYDFEKIHSEITNATSLFRDRSEPHFIFGRYCNQKEEAMLAYKHLSIAKEFDIETVKTKYHSFIREDCYGKYVNDELSVACYNMSKFEEGIKHLEHIIDDVDFSSIKDRLDQNYFFFKRELSERELLSSYFEKDYKGVFIDVGPADPIYRNKSYYYECAGWKTYCIEPDKKLFEKFKTVRQNVYNFSCVLRSSNQENIEVKGLKSFIEEEQISKVDILSINTNSNDLDILAGLDLNITKPKIIIAENDYGMNIIQSYLVNFGYSKVNRIHVKDYFIFNESFVPESVPTIRYVSSGNFGDLIHQLYVIKDIYERTGVKGELFLMDGYPEPWKEPDWDKKGFFQNGASNTSSEVKYLLQKQKYLSSVSEYTNYIEGMLHLNPWIYLVDDKKCWTETFSDCFRLPYPKSVDKWLNVDQKDPRFVGKVVIHESLVDWRRNDDFPWLDILNNNICVFVSFNEEHYQNFKYKERVYFYKMNDFEECCIILNSCKFYIGNLTSITAIARALCIPMLVELTTFKSFDAWHYIGEEKYWNDFFYIDDRVPNKIQGLDRYINCSF